MPSTGWLVKWVTVLTLGDGQGLGLGLVSGGHGGVWMERCQRPEMTMERRIYRCATGCPKAREGTNPKLMLPDRIQEPVTGLGFGQSHPTTPGVLLDHTTHARLGYFSGLGALRCSQVLAGCLRSSRDAPGPAVEGGHARKHAGSAVRNPHLQCLLFLPALSASSDRHAEIPNTVQAVPHPVPSPIPRVLTHHA